MSQFESSPVRAYSRIKPICVICLDGTFLEFLEQYRFLNDQIARDLTSKNDALIGKDRLNDAKSSFGESIYRWGEGEVEFSLLNDFFHHRMTFNW